MNITLKTGIAKKNAIKKIDRLLNWAGLINGGWDRDEMIYNWNCGLHQVLSGLFKNSAEIITRASLKGSYDQDLKFELIGRCLPEKYEERRKSRSENNKIVFLHQLSVLSQIKEELEGDQSKNTIDNGIDDGAAKRVVVLPAETKWSDLTIRWMNGNDVEVTLKNNKKFKKTLDYKELGFYDNKRKGPNISWQILTTAAGFDGKFHWDGLGGVSEVERLKKIAAFQKRVSDIRRQLKLSFGINNDPFETYGKIKEYVIKINLIPEKRGAETRANSWEDLMPKEDAEKFKEISKKELFKNPNDNSHEYLGKY